MQRKSGLGLFVRAVTAALRILPLALIALLGLRVAHAATVKPTVAVLYFDYAGKDDDLAVLRKGLAQMMISDLAGIDAIQLVERSRLEDILNELKLGEERKLDASTAAKVGKLLGARYLVLGSYFELKAKLRIDARVVEVETGKVIQSVGATGDSDDFGALEQKLVGEVGVVLNKQVPPTKPSAPSHGAHPGSASSTGPAATSAARARPPARLGRRTASLYGRALHDVDTGNKARAKERLKQVVQEQPDFALASIDLDKLMQ